MRKRLAEIVKAAVRPFKGWTEFFEFLVFLSACVAGVANASWLWVLVGALLLLLLGWRRWEALFVKAGDVDAEWRELGTLARRHNVGWWGLEYLCAPVRSLSFSARRSDTMRCSRGRVLVRARNAMVLVGMMLPQCS